jgi:GTPase SAR1 family protein
MPAPPKTIPTSAGLQLVLFGLPGSGKSSLLGALVQAAASQSAVLRGKLVDDTGRLAELRRSTYAENLPATTEEVVAYPVAFEPQGSQAFQAALLDSDGRLAQQYLAGKRPLEPRDSDLAQALLGADTIVLTLDVTAGGQVEAHLAAFRRFLSLLQEVRGRRTDVADLPVWLVLTKCDQLAKPDDTFSKWVQRVEEAKRKLGDRVAEFLFAKPGRAAFGTIHLNLWATAMRRPALANQPAPAAEPYGVAELFRQCLASAQKFDRRERRSGRRLELAVGGLGFLVILMLLLSAVFALTQPDTELMTLEEQVQTLLPDSDAKAERRLRGPVKERLAQLDRIRENEAFSKLTVSTRDAVEQARAELAAYLQARQKVQDDVKEPFQAKNEAEFDQFEKQAHDFALPPSYAAAWTDTRLAHQLAKMREEYARVRAAVDEKVRWIRKHVDDGKRLNDQAYSEVLPMLVKTEKSKREQAARPWFAAYANFRKAQYVHSSEQPLTGVTSYIYADLDKFQAVRAARKEWDKVRRDLDETYDLVVKRMAD